MSLNEKHIQVGLLVIAMLCIFFAVAPVGKKARAVALAWFALP